MQQKTYRRTYVEIDASVLEANVRTITQHYSYEYYIGVVKGNSYGHGSDSIEALIAGGINYLAVSSLDEALAVREFYDLPLLILEPVHLDELDICSQNNFAIIVHDVDYFESMLKREVGAELKIHLKLDTGLNRLGLSNKDDVDSIYAQIEGHKYFRLEGIYTHFATSGISDLRYKAQIDSFLALTADIDLAKIPLVHVDKSSTFVHHSKLPFVNAVRMGIIMFGFASKAPVWQGTLGKLRKLKREHLQKKLGIEGILYPDIELNTAYRFCSEILQIKAVGKGEYVGYGSAYQATEDILIAVVAVGFADGYSKRNTGSYVSINQKRYPIIGEVGMNMTIIKVDASVKLSDEVVLVGDAMPLRQASAHLGTNAYELMTMIDSSIPRVLKKN